MNDGQAKEEAYLQKRECNQMVAVQAVVMQSLAKARGVHGQHCISARAKSHTHLSKMGSETTVACVITSTNCLIAVP